MVNYLAVDFGTTKLCAAGKIRGQFTTIQIEQNDLNPSDVFLGDQIYVGRQARKMGEKDPSRLVTNIKRLIGRTINDPLLVEYCENQEFSIVEVDGSLALECSVKGSTKTYFLYDIISDVLRYVLKEAEQSCNCTFDGLVLTIPPVWNENQKTEFIRCAHRLSVPHIEIVTETVASCLNAGYSPSKKVRYVMVVDGGGGTFDVTTLRISKAGGFEVIATNGLEIGGIDFTKALLKDVMSQLQSLGMDITKLTPSQRSRIHSIVEETKISLSSQDTASLDVDSRSGDVLHIQVTKENLANDCHTLFKRCWEVVANTIEQSAAQDAKPEYLILCGDGLRIDKLWKSIAGYFSDSFVTNLPSNSVAMGAAIFSQMDYVQKRHYDGDACQIPPTQPPTQPSTQPPTQPPTGPSALLCQSSLPRPVLSFTSVQPLVPDGVDANDLRPNSIIGFDGSQLDPSQLRESQIPFPLPRTSQITNLEEYTVSEKRSYNVYIAKQPIYPNATDLRPIIQASAVLPFSSVPLHWKTLANRPLIIRLYEGCESYKSKCRCIRILELQRDEYHSLEKECRYSCICTADVSGILHLDFHWDDTKEEIKVAHDYSPDRENKSIATLPSVHNVVLPAANETVSEDEKTPVLEFSVCYYSFQVYFKFNFSSLFLYLYPRMEEKLFIITRGGNTKRDGFSRSCSTHRTVIH